MKTASIYPPPIPIYLSIYLSIDRPIPLSFIYILYIPPRARASLRDDFLRLFVREENDGVGRERAHDRRSKPTEKAAQTFPSQLALNDAKQRHGDRAAAGLQLRLDCVQGKRGDPSRDACRKKDKSQESRRASKQRRRSLRGFLRLQSSAVRLQTPIIAA